MCNLEICNKSLNIFEISLMGVFFSYIFMELRILFDTNKFYVNIQFSKVLRS